MMAIIVIAVFIILHINTPFHVLSHAGCKFVMSDLNFTDLSVYAFNYVGVHKF